MLSHVEVKVILKLSSEIWVRASCLRGSRHTLKFKFGRGSTLSKPFLDQHDKLWTNCVGHSHLSRIKWSRVTSSRN